jgi:hypothetical protein
VRLEGSLDAFSLPDIFSLLSMTKKTGGLHLRRAGEHGVVWLSDGLLTGGSSDLTRQSLGRRIAGSGLVSDDALAAAVGQVGHGEDLGIARALRDSLSVDEGELHTLVSEHIVDSVFDLMRWADGEFEFVVDEPNVDDVGVKREVDEVVGEARRRLDAWAEIDSTVASPGTVLSLALDPSGDPIVSRDEWALLALVDGRRSVADVVEMCGRGQYAVAVALAELASRGLLRANDTDGVAALIRRQELLTSLEGGPAPQVTKPAGPAPGAAVDPFPAAPPLPSLPVDEPAVPVSSGPTLVSSASETSSGDSGRGELAEVASIARTSVETSSVTPQRPDFLPSREPEHPEPLAAAAGGGVVSGAVPASAIERDPSVNKSLLLRLIAGVRGL